MASKSKIDSLRAEDISQCVALVEQYQPGNIPRFGEANQHTIVLRDVDDSSKIHGLIHMETATEVRKMIVEPNYEFGSMALTIGWNAMEGILRWNGVKQYLATVPADAQHLLRFYKGDGAVLIDENTKRFLKRL